MKGKCSPTPERPQRKKKDERRDERHWNGAKLLCLLRVPGHSGRSHKRRLVFERRCRTEQREHPKRRIEDEMRGRIDKCARGIITREHRFRITLLPVRNVAHAIARFVV